MPKQAMTIEEAAQALVEEANSMSLEEFSAVAASMLEDNSPAEIAAIAAHLPDESCFRSGRCSKEHPRPLRLLGL